MSPDPETELQHVTQIILSSTASKRIIVAGPGTGKTRMFRQILEQRRSDSDRLLVLTFINNLKAELEKDLGHLARVFTFHGYCRRLLHTRPTLRPDLTDAFHYFPPLPSLVKIDWELGHGNRAPQFIGLMRQLKVGTETDFYIQRANYYDAVSFDDSVFRVYQQLFDDPAQVEEYDVVLVDEYQDFNRLEAAFIDLLAIHNQIVIAGDDDQALYRQLRGSNPEFIRKIYTDGEYQSFQLPFCMRCTQVIVESVGDIIERAQRHRNLEGRISKEYRFFPPQKTADSTRYPKIKLVQVSTQSKKTNYFGRYIAEQIRQIQVEEIVESRRANFPTVLIIGRVQYRRQIREYLESQGSVCEMSEAIDPSDLDRSDGLKILREQPEANLGWRVLLQVDQPDFYTELVRQSLEERFPLIQRIPSVYREQILREASVFREEIGGNVQLVEDQDETRPSIKLTSFEGSKGLSAQHVFIVGLHEAEFPRDAAKIDDLEICCLVVALTRTRKQCYLLYTFRWGGTPKRPSVFLNWIRPQRLEHVTVDKSYWSERPA